MDCKEVFKQLVRYIPAGEDTRLYNNMRAFGEACLAAGEFDEAANYADVLLAQDNNENRRIAACRIRLFVKLHCRNSEEFRHCEAFSKEMPEYLELVAACESEAASSKLIAILKLVNDNIKTVAVDKQRREEEERRREEEERQRRLQKKEEERRKQQQLKTARRKEEMLLRKAQIAEEERRKEELRRAELEREKQKRFTVLEKKISRYTWACWGSFILATLFFVVGVVLWCVFGDQMPYRFADLGWLFVVALILYVAVFVFAGKRKKAEKQYAAFNTQGNNKIAENIQNKGDLGVIFGIILIVVLSIVGAILGVIL